MTFSARNAAFLALPLLGLSGCGYFDSRMVHKAQFSMIGMSSNDLQACVGVPDKTQKLNDTTQIFQYTYKPSATNSFSIAPLNLSTISFGGTGSYCTVVAKIHNDRLIDLHYTGDNDETIGNDGVCSAIIRGCMRQPEATMTTVNGSIFGKVSAFSSPQLPAQPSAAVYNIAPGAQPAVAAKTAAAPAAKAAAKKP